MVRQRVTFAMIFWYSFVLTLPCLISCVETVPVLECGARFSTETPGFFSSSMQNKNRDNKWCKYTIWSDRSDYNVRLQFTRRTASDISTNSDECYGKVIVYDGSLSKVLGVYCYNTLPDTVESTTNSIILEYIEADLKPEQAEELSFVVKYSTGSRTNVHNFAKSSDELLRQGYQEPMNNEVDPCEEQNKEVDRLTGQRDALYISVIVFGSVGVVMVVMLSIAIHIISGREVKLRRFANVSLTDPYLLELKAEKKGSNNSSEDDESATRLTEREAEGNENKGFEEIVEGAVGGEEK